ncbi:hypothetical protein E3P99_02686 [Wallemia hederae]|uniref:Uncharacterized protein n=1 Tax=Wallemia hederae TaxID=1540922 RepID=A0A4T0FJ45_9BASI|nr:hypothetical protein E3P99_02686 [Wallemia hederae]
MTYKKASKQLLSRDFTGCLDTIESSYKEATSTALLNKLLSLELTCWLTLYLSKEKDLKHAQLGYNSSQFVDYLLRLSHSRIDGLLPGGSQSALLLAILRLDQLDKAKHEAENWLYSASVADQDYNQVRDVYAFNILPQLGEWDVSREFLLSSTSDKAENEALLQRLSELQEAEGKERLASLAESAANTEPSTPSLSRSSSNGSSYTATPARMQSAVKHENEAVASVAQSNTDQYSTQSTTTLPQHLETRSRMSEHAKQPPLEPISQNSRKQLTTTAKLMKLMAPLKEILPRVLPPLVIFILAVMFASRRRNNAEAARSIRDRLARRDSLWNKLLQTLQMGTRGMLP